MTSNVKGFFSKLLVIDCETSGLAFGTDDPSHNPETNQTYQSVSWGMLVVDTESLKVLDSLYVEIQPDEDCVWDARAEAVHGLSKQYLEQHGDTAEDAVLKIGQLILKHWGPDSPVSICGHNVVHFDLPFLKRLLRSQDLNIKFSHRSVDTNSIGFSVFNTYTSDQLFDLLNVKRDPTNHNALEDAMGSLTVLRAARAALN